MSQIGTLTASSSDIFNRPDTPANILIGSVDLDVPLSALSVSIRGIQTINITAQARIQCFAKWIMGATLGADVKVGMLLRLAEDAVTGQACQIRTTNAGATTPNVFEFSDGKNSSAPIVYAAGEETIQASSPQRFEGSQFSMMAFDATNVTDCQLEFIGTNGEIFSQLMTAVELDAYRVLQGFPSDADGKLAGLTVIDNMDSNILSVTINNGSGGTTTLMTVNVG